MKKYSWGDPGPFLISELIKPSVTEGCPHVNFGLSTDVIGVYRPCCNYEDNYHWNNNKPNLEEYKKSSIKLAEEFASGKWPLGCLPCKKFEDSGIVSKRTFSHLNYKNYLANNPDMNENKYLIVDIRLSNTCNLGCVSCNPRLSSFIEEEFKSKKDKILNIDRDYSQKILKTYKYSNQEIDDIVDNISAEGVDINLAGGEPTLIKEYYYLLEKMIEKGLHKSVNVVITSNITTYNPKFIELAKQFKGFLTCSIDGLGEQGEFIRYKSDWKTTVENLNKFKKELPNWDIRINPTISILNIHRFNEFYSYFTETGYSLNYFLNILMGPNHLDIRILPDEEKERLIESFKDLPSNHRERLTNFLRNPGYSPSEKIYYRKYAVDTLDSIDKVRNTNWKDTFPELYSLLKNIT
jgi:MoaA/NifB/PqqE/SkfB family radical SAM enzyme